MEAANLIRCENCKGEGIIAGTRHADGSIDTCPVCHGRGEIPSQTKADGIDRWVYGDDQPVKVNRGFGVDAN